MCKQINQGLLVSECFRELDAQIKFRETLKKIDKDEEDAYVNKLKEDVAKYEEETKEKMEKQREEKRNYATELKKQIEEIKNIEEIKKKKRFELEKQDQINMNKFLQDIKEYEAQQLQNKKEKLKQFFKEAIEDKKQFDLELEHEDKFEDRAIEIYRNAQLRIQKLHKSLKLKEKEEKEHHAQQIYDQFDKYRIILNEKLANEERLLKKAQEEQEENYQKNQKIRKENHEKVLKEIKDFRTERINTKLKQLQEDEDMKMWEMMQRYKTNEYDREVEIEEQKKNWNKKVEYGEEIKKYISEKEEERRQAKLDEDETPIVKKIIDIENKKILDYAEEVVNESKGVRPLYPILKAVKKCKEQMGLLSPKKKEETIVTKPKRKRKTHRYAKFVPEEKICYV
ncbi:golgin subfamily A member 6-like protein 22 [Apis laboriosa]|uniref:golgin subfamily A member 6-like protein 22 n=1 Tax=Apis laboriosa TaxID=183418 RepID=UPI001CC5A35F|nr:golgin subfamily A member 6-like protein 22 [Apis laboriosa]